MGDEHRNWPQRLHVVTGKGGTGKSTVAAALALGLASQGKDVLLCEVEGRQGIARMFDVDPLPYEERRLTTGLPDEGGRTGVVHALHIEPEAALLEYLAMYYKLGRAGRALDRSDPFACAVWMFEDISAKRPLAADLTLREREVAQVAAEEPETAAKMVQPSTLKCSSRPGRRVSKGARPSNMSSESLVR